MNDEEEGPSITRLVETLDPADQKRAIEGMTGLHGTGPSEREC